jgi:[acyl-carrier-protein] S-malonyltransferase
MGRDLSDRFSSVHALFDQADAILGYSLSTLCFEGPEAELRRTLHTQPAVFVVSHACWVAARESGAIEGMWPQFVAGHSLGEYTALVAAGALSFEEGLRLVQARARLMEEAGRREPGTMAAILGLDAAILEQVCGEHGVEIANLNAPDQIVISGAVERLPGAMEAAKAAGARRVIPLDVGGAFHSRLMRHASAGIEAAVTEVDIKDPAVPVMANSTALPLVTAGAVRAELVQQLCAPVRWVDSVRVMCDHGVTTFFEFGPGKVLTGLAKRIAPEAVVANYGDAAAMVAR